MREDKIKEFEAQSDSEWLFIREDTLRKLVELANSMSLHDPKRAKLQHQIGLLSTLDLPTFKECFVTNLRSRN